MRFILLAAYLIAFAWLFESHAQQNINNLTSKQITVNGKIEVNSTSQSSKPCPAMTEAQRDAIVSPVSGSCVYNTNTLTLNIYNGTIWKSAGGGISNWETAFNYALNDVVIESNKIYQCNTAHTSTVFASDIANWTQIDNNVSDASGVLPMANGGTDKNLTPVLGGIVYTDANSMEVLAAGTSGQVLKSNGAAAPTWQDASNKLQGEKQSEVSFTKLKARNRSVTQTGTGEYLLEDQENLLYNGNFESATLLDGWTCANSSYFSAETTEPLDGNKSLKVQPLTVGEYTCYQDFNINQNQRGQSLLLSAMVRASGTDTLQICYRENGVVTNICTEPVSVGFPFTQATIGSSATSIGYQFTIPYNSLGLVVRMDKFDMRIGTAVTNQPVVTNFKDYGPTPLPGATTTPPAKPTTIVTDRVLCGQVGPRFLCDYDYYHTNSVGSAKGSGGYIHYLPVGAPDFDDSYPFDSNLASTTYRAAMHQSIVGWCSFDVPGGGTLGDKGSLIATGPRTFQCITWYAATNSAVHGSTYGHYNYASMGFKFHLDYRGKGLQSSVPTYTGRCSNRVNCATTLTASRSTSNVISGSNPSDWGLTTSGTSQVTLSFPAGRFTVAPKCWARIEGGNQVVADAVSMTTTSGTINLTDSTGNTSNMPIRIYCERQGDDFDNAFTLQQNVALKNYPETVAPQGYRAKRMSFYFGSGTNCTSDCTTGTCSICGNVVGVSPVIVHSGSAGKYNITNIPSTYNCIGHGATASMTALIGSMMPQPSSSYHQIVVYTTSTGADSNGRGAVQCDGYE